MPDTFFLRDKKSENALSGIFTSEDTGNFTCIFPFLNRKTQIYIKPVALRFYAKLLEKIMKIRNLAQTTHQTFW